MKAAPAGASLIAVVALCAVVTLAVASVPAATSAGAVAPAGPVATASASSSASVPQDPHRYLDEEGRVRVALVMIGSAGAVESCWDAARSVR